MPAFSLRLLHYYQGPTKEQRANTTHAIGDFVERIDVGHHAICTAG